MELKESRAWTHKHSRYITNGLYRPCRHSLTLYPLDIIHIVRYLVRHIICWYTQHFALMYFFFSLFFVVFACFASSLQYYWLKLLGFFFSSFISLCLFWYIVLSLRCVYEESFLFLHIWNYIFLYGTSQASVVRIKSIVCVFCCRKKIIIIHYYQLEEMRTKAI